MVLQLLHFKSTVFARLTPVLPNTNRTFSIRLPRVLPRCTVLQGAVLLGKKDLEGVAARNNAHSMPDAYARRQCARHKIEAVALVHFWGERVKPHDRWIVGEVELEHVVLVRTGSSKHEPTALETTRTSDVSEKSRKSFRRVRPAHHPFSRPGANVSTPFRADMPGATIQSRIKLVGSRNDSSNSAIELP